MKTLRMFAALAAAMVSMFTMVGWAQATDWHAAPAGGAFTGSSPTSVLFKVSGKGTSCTTPTMSGTVTGSGGGIAGGPPFMFDWYGAATVTQSFTGCSNAGITLRWSCAPSDLSLAALEYNGGLGTTEAGSAGKSSNVLMGIICTIKPVATPSNNCTTLTGTVPGVYTNPATLAAGTGAANTGSLAINTTGQSLTAASVGSCIVGVGTGPATLTWGTPYRVSGSPAASVAAPHFWAD